MVPKLEWLTKINCQEYAGRKWCVQVPPTFSARGFVVQAIFDVMTAHRCKTFTDANRPSSKIEQAATITFNFPDATITIPICSLPISI